MKSFLRQAGRAALRPRLERLEDRTVPSSNIVVEWAAQREWCQLWDDVAALLKPSHAQ